MADEASSAVSGGMLVILGIVVAVALGFLFFGGHFGGAPKPDIAITLPK